MSSNVRYPSSSTQFPVPLSPWPVYQMSTENNQESQSSIEGYPNIVKFCDTGFFFGWGGGANAEESRNSGTLTNNKKPAINHLLTSFVCTLQLEIFHSVFDDSRETCQLHLLKMAHDRNIHQILLIIFLYEALYHLHIISNAL